MYAIDSSTRASCKIKIKSFKLWKVVTQLISAYFTFAEVTTSYQFGWKAYLWSGLALPGVWKQVFELSIAVSLGGGLGHGLEAGSCRRGGLPLCHHSSVLLWHSHGLSACQERKNTMLSQCIDFHMKIPATSCYIQLKYSLFFCLPTVYDFDLGLAGLWEMVEQDLVIFFINFDLS